MSSDFKHNRRSCRLHEWDYRTPGSYFITIKTGDGTHCFNNPRLKAIAENNAAAAETALEDGAKYRLTAFPENPLHVVARGISLELVKALVRHCDASLKDEKGYTLLDIAVRHAQCPAIVDYLACRCEDAQALESALRLVPDPAAGVGAGGAVVDETAEITEIKKKLHTVLL